MDEGKARPSLDVLDEHTDGASPGETSIRPMSRVAFRLKSPVWDKYGGRSSSSSPGSQPRRSKRSQQASAKTSQSRCSQSPGKQNEPIEDDISPTNSAPGTPRLMNPNPHATGQDPGLLTQPSELCLSNATNCPSRDSEIIGSRKNEPPVQRQSNVAEPKGNIDRKIYSAVPGDGHSYQVTEYTNANAFLPVGTLDQNTSTPQGSLAAKGTAARHEFESEDSGVPVTCALFPRPFRRDSSARPSPVRERIGIFEALNKPGPHSPQIGGSDDKKTQRDRPRSQPFLTGTSVLGGKKLSAGWLPKPFRKMSLHLGKGKRHSEDMGGAKEQASKGHDSSNQSTNPNTGSDEAKINNDLAPPRPSQSVETDGKSRDQH